MPIIKCGTNRVAADEPEDDHTHVQVFWFGPPTDGVHRRVFEGPLEPIEMYEEAVAWACEMAEQMVHPLYVLPMTGAEVLQKPQVQRVLAELTPQQRGELRREVVTMLVDIMRDCHDRRVRADAHAVLVDFGVIRG